jgi:hypothetical protein
MEYVGIFLVLVAAGLSLISGHVSRPDRPPTETTTFRVIPAIPPGPAAILVGAAGVFIFVTSISRS